MVAKEVERKVVGADEIPFRADIEKNVNGEKVVFHIEVFDEVDHYNNLKILYSIGNSKEKYNAWCISESKQAIIFYTEKEINGIKVKGIKVDDEVFQKILEIKKKAIEKKKQSIKREFKNNLSLSFYFGDYYRVNAWFISPNGDDIVADDMVRDHIHDRYEIWRDGSEIARNVASFFDFKWFYKQEEIEVLKKEFKEKYGLEIVEHYIDDLRGKGYYVADVKGPLEAWNKIFDVIYIPQAKKEREEKEKIEKMRQEALKKAKETGKEVIIRKIGGYDGDDWKQVQMFGTKEIKRNFGELGWVNVYEVATPDGKIIEKHYPSY